MTDINDVFYGINTTNLLLRKPWSPLLGSPPSDVTEGFVYIAEDDGDVDLGGGNGVESFVEGDSIVYKDGVWIRFGSAAGGALSWEAISAAQVLDTGVGYLVDYGTTPTEFNVELPESPAEGDQVVVWHVRGDVNAMGTLPKILRNTTSNENIDALAEDIDINVNYEKTTFVYSGIAAIGWRSA